MDEVFTGIKSGYTRKSGVSSASRAVAYVTILLYVFFSFVLLSFLFMEIHSLTYRVISTFLILIMLSNVSAKIVVGILKGHEEIDTKQ